MSLNLRLHLRFIKMAYAGRLAYRADYAISTVAMFLAMLTGPVFISAVYGAGGVVPGWTLPELLLLQGTLMIVKGFGSMLFFGMLWGSQQLMRSGTFDLLLVRPVPILHLLVMQSFDAEDTGQFASGIAITGLALWLLPPLHGSLATYLAFILAGILFYLAIGILCVVLTVRVLNTGRLYEIVDAITVFASYPKDIYGKGLGIAFSTILPLLVAGSYPASALLGKSTDGALLALVCSVGFLALALFAWRGAMRHYTSAGG